MDKDTALVCIVGAGPAGLVLAHILHQSNISFVILGVLKLDAEHSSRRTCRADGQAGLRSSIAPRAA
jgi:2-polyprenyl-6-methoxyphenol hydroxylase-like FAD-dependent oxidoreductase